MAREYSIGTKAIHAGEPRPRVSGAITMPIFQSSTFEYGDEASYHDIRYLRLSNTPNQTALSTKLAALEGAETGVVAASGMAAISATLLATLRAGDHVLAQDSLYGGTHALLTQDLPNLGIAVEFVDATQQDGWAQRLRPNTRVVYTESITNPMGAVADHRAIIDFARRHNLLAVIDNTFATPINFRPLEIGYDIVVHSCTKYLNGHSDIVAGAVLGTRTHVELVTHKLNHFGGSLDPHACFLLHRGLKTLALRMERHNDNALQIARYLLGHPAVAEVYYPGLPTSPHYRRAEGLFSGFGGVVSFRLRAGLGAARRLVRSLNIPAHAASLGGVESLILLPAQSTHQQLAATERERIGLADDVVRFAIGIEVCADLVDDLEQGLAAL